MCNITLNAMTRLSLWDCETLEEIPYLSMFQGCLTRRTWRFGRRFRTRTNGHTCPSVLFRRTFACEKFFTNFFFTLGNFSEADVSNLDPRWRRARADRCARAQTGKGARTCLRAAAGTSARTHMSANKMAPSGTHGLFTGIAAV